MTHTTLPSIKGQVTIPVAIREKYHISKETPLVIEDKGKGVIIMKVMRLAPHTEVELYNNKKEVGLTFPHGIDPNVLISVIKKIDG
jgi:AbrB family looped-hinge helix DNA binding protein